MEQVDTGTSLASQLDTCRRKADALGVPVVAHYEDAGISGGLLTARDGMMKSIADIKAGRAGMLICAEMSRYSRDVEHQWAIKKEIESAGARVVFCDTEFEDTPEGELNFTIQGGFKQYERKVFRSRSIRGRRWRAQEGIQTARSQSAYGYHVPTRDEVLRGEYRPEQLGRYIVMEAEADVVSRLYREYATGLTSLTKLSEALNSEGVPTPKGGKCWRASSFHKILSNPIYVGRASFGKTESRTDESFVGRPHPITGQPLKSASITRLANVDKVIQIEAPRLVDDATWEEVQRRLHGNKSLRGGNPIKARMLSGRVFCSHCGSPMRVRSDHGTVRYVCKWNYPHDGETFERRCEPGSHRISDTEQAVVEALLSAIRQPEAIEAAVRVYTETGRQDKSAQDIEMELGCIEKALTALKRRESDTITAQIAGVSAGADPGLYNNVFQEIAAERRKLEGRQVSLTEELQRLGGGRGIVTVDRDEAKRKAIADTHRALLEDGVSGSDRRDLVASVVEKVYCERGGARVEFRQGLIVDDTLHNTSVPD